MACVWFEHVEEDFSIRVPGGEGERRYTWASSGGKN